MLSVDVERFTLYYRALLSSNHALLFLNFQKFQGRKDSAPIIKINSTTPDASSSQESIRTAPNSITFRHRNSASAGGCLEDNNLYSSDFNGRCKHCCYDTSCYRSPQYSEVNLLLNNINKLTSCSCDQCRRMWCEESKENCQFQVSIIHLQWYDQDYIRIRVFYRKNPQ